MSRPRPIGSSRESTSNLSQRSGRLSESQNHYVTPPNGGRSTRTHSIAVPRGVSGPGAIGRPIMWTKQATLQKNNGLAYASQPTDGASQLGLSQAFALSQSNGSSFQPASHHNSGNLTPGNVPHSLASSSNRVGSTSGLGAGAHAPPQPHHQHQQHDERESRADIAKHPSKSRTHHKSDSSGSSVGAPPAVQAEATHAGSSGAGTTGGDAAPASGAASVAARAITTRQNTAANASVAQSEGVLGHVLSMNALTRNSENISLVSSQPYRDILKKIGHPLRGPVLQEFGVHYSFFLLVLFVAWQTSWAPQIRFYLAVFYFFISCFCLTTSRLIFSRLPNSSIPFYISFIPLAVLIYISREAHQIVMMLWFISFLIIFLQSGHPQLAKHLLFFCIAYVVVYVAMLGLMVATYKSDCFTLYCSVALSTAISPLYEGLLLIDFLFIMGIFNRLERFIKLNASTLLDRENYMQHLYIANMDLKRQLRNAKIDNEVDLEAPLTR
ncbi:3',5'-cyclic-nucleotide phosphodiesterase, partial [Polyrhizophydium stewartii]